MAGLSPKIKEGLALLYDSSEFKYLEAWNKYHVDKCGRDLILVQMGQPGSEARIAMLQGKASAHQLMLDEIRKFHKEVVKD